MNAMVPLMMAPCEDNAGANSVVWYQNWHQLYHMAKSHITDFLDHLHKCNDAVGDADTGTNGITWLTKSCCTLFYCLELINTMLPLMITSASHDVALYHMTKNIITHCVDCLHLTNKMVCLLIPLMSHDTDSSTNNIAWPKKSFCTSFQLFQPNEYRHEIDNAICTIWY